MHLTINKYNNLITKLNKDNIPFSTKITDNITKNNLTQVKLSIYSEGIYCYPEINKAFWIDKYDICIEFNFWITFNYYKN